jgi:hypothetical protein
LAVEGLKVRCADEQERQYWFDSSLLERCHWTKLGPEAAAWLPTISTELDSTAIVT